MDVVFTSHFSNITTVSQLQSYLQERGVVTSGIKKAELIDLCCKARDFNLEVDPEGLVEDRLEVLSSKLKDGFINLTGNPALLTATTNISFLPNFSQFDVFSYLLINKDDCNHSFLREHTRSEGYTLMKDGFVQSLEAACFPEPGYFVLKGSVRPRTRDKDPVSGAATYFPWVVLTNTKTDERSQILSAYCTCKGGIDGCCRHVQALLYEVIDFRDDSKVTSVTSGQCMWVRRATGAEKPTLLNEIRISLNQSPLKSAQAIPKDLSVTTSSEDLFAGVKKFCPSPCALLLLEKKTESTELEPPPLRTVKTLSEKRSEFFSGHNCSQSSCDCEELFLEYALWSNEEYTKCKEETKGQSANSNWYLMRYGLITASNVKKVLHCRDPETTAKTIMKRNSEQKEYEPEAITFGKESESKAIDQFFKAHRYRHRQCQFQQPGLCLSTEFAFLAASPDAIGYCCNKDCGSFIVEVKSLFTHRNYHPKLAIKQRNFCYHDENGKLTLKNTTDYYYQIQCQMAVTGIKKGFLVIYTKKGIESIYVPFDPVFWTEKSEKLKAFWKKHVASKII